MGFFGRKGSVMTDDGEKEYSFEDGDEERTG